MDIAAGHVFRDRIADDGGLIPIRTYRLPGTVGAVAPVDGDRGWLLAANRGFAPAGPGWLASGDRGGRVGGKPDERWRRRPPGALLGRDRGGPSRSGGALSARTRRPGRCDARRPHDLQWHRLEPRRPHDVSRRQRPARHPRVRLRRRCGNDLRRAGPGDGAGRSRDPGRPHRRRRQATCGSRSGEAVASTITPRPASSAMSWPFRRRRRRAARSPAPACIGSTSRPQPRTGRTTSVAPTRRQGSSTDSRPMRPGARPTRSARTQPGGAH